MPVKIGNKDYVTVAERVQALHAERDETMLSIDTDIAAEDEQYVTVKATVVTAAGTFTGHARSDKKKQGPFEGANPLEVAETSAIGRALGFAGFGIVEGIASADEVKLATRPVKEPEGAPKDTPEAAARRKLWALAQEKGMDEAALKAFLVTDSLKALAAHMTSGEKNCGCGYPHALKDAAAAYREMTARLEAVQ